MKKQLFFSLIFVTLFSCTKTIEFDDEGLANQVVVNSFIYPENEFSAVLTKSSSILEDKQNNPPLEGTLDLYEDGNLLRHFDSQVGRFMANDIKPKAGKTYRIVVASNGKQVEAETSVPNQVDVISLDTTSVMNEWGSRIINYKLKIKDPAGDDYYRIVIMNESLTTMTFKDNYQKETIGYYKNNIQYSVLSDDPVFKSVYNNFGDELTNMGPSNDYSIFPDSYFQGKEYTIQFQASSGYGYFGGYVNYGDPQNPNLSYGGKLIYDKNTIHIQKLSKDLYYYLKYMKLYNHYRDNPFAEPVPVYSNVKNGVGIFAGFNDDVRLKYEKIYVPYSMDTITPVENTFPYYGY